MTSRASRLAAAVVAATAALASGCSYPCAACHPALVICGTTLQNAGGGVGIAPYFVLRGPVTISYVPQTVPLYFQVALGCAHGSQVAWTPRSAGHLVQAAYASDGLAAAVVLQPTGHPKVFRLVVATSRRATRTITVHPAW